jgi:hypothetical protein
MLFLVVIHRLELKLNSEQNVEDIFVASHSTQQSVGYRIIAYC